MNRKKNNKGFSMAEMMITVAILAVLAGLAVVGVIQYQRSMQQLELDAVAKQIYISAQNHLSLVDSQGFLELSNDPNKEEEVFGYPDIGDKGVGKYFFVYGEKNNPFTDSDSSLLDLILPFGSVEETVRTGGSFVIHYQKSPAIILDVFYASRSGRFSFDYSTINFKDEEKVAELMSYAGEDKKGDRRNAFDGSVIGWYGGDGLKSGPELNAPSITIKNDNTLEVIIFDSNTDYSSLENYRLQLVIRGLSSKTPPVVITSDKFSAGSKNGEYICILDTICGSSNLENFAKRFPTFYPGENISIQAKAFFTDVLTNVATSERKVTNSLFDSGSTVETINDSGIVKYEVHAAISSIRHLENLSKSISNCGIGSLKVVSAVQIKDLVWDSYWSQNSNSIKPIDGSPNNRNTFRAITPAAPLSYDGRYHKITGIVVDESSSDDPSNTSKSAGLFGIVTGPEPEDGVPAESSISNLELVDCSVVGGNNAGALVGSATNTEITNVLARSSEKDSAIISTGNSGGLVGAMDGGSITACAASMTTEGSSYAGGLVGITSGTVNITNCYSSGHTEQGEYYTHSNGRAPMYNIKASGSAGVAGGLVGSYAGGKIASSYSTCSVSGKTAGGFIGNAAGGTVENCYCTGLVELYDGYNNAFIGSGSPTFTTNKDSYYYRIINEVIDTHTQISISYKDPGNIAVKAIDEAPEETGKSDLQVYNTFLGAVRKKAVPYDTTLGKQYHLLTVEQLGGTIPEKYYVKDHYGDWPTPEGQVVNIPG